MNEVKGIIPSDVEMTVAENAPVKDADGNVIGRVVDSSSDDTGLSITADIDDATYQDLLFGRAQAEQKRLAAKRVDDLIIAGAKNAADILDNPNLQERTAMEAVARTLRATEHMTVPERKQPGPSRRKAPRPDARKRQRQARKRNR